MNEKKLSKLQKCILIAIYQLRGSDHFGQDVWGEGSNLRSVRRILFGIGRWRGDSLSSSEASSFSRSLSRLEKRNLIICKNSKTGADSHWDFGILTSEGNKIVSNLLKQRIDKSFTRVKVKFWVDDIEVNRLVPKYVNWRS